MGMVVVWGGRWGGREEEEEGVEGGWQQAEVQGGEEVEGAKVKAEEVRGGGAEGEEAAGRVTAGREVGVGGATAVARVGVEGRGEGKGEEEGGWEESMGWVGWWWWPSVEVTASVVGQGEGEEWEVWGA